MSLKELFISNSNVTYILDTTIKNIYNLTNKEFLLKKDKNLFDTFNHISTSIFKYEYKELIKKEINKSIIILNNIVISQLTEFILNKYKSSNKTITPDLSVNVIPDNIISISDQVNREHEIVKNKDEIHEDHTNNIEKYDLHIDSLHTDILIENIISMKVKSLYMYNNDYYINDYNNVLIFREKLDINKELYSEEYKVVIEPGDYTKESLTEEIEYQMSNISKNKYKCYIEPITGYTAITIENNNIEDFNMTFKNLRELKDKLKNNNTNIYFKIDENSTILSTLGFDLSSSKSEIDDSCYNKYYKYFISNNPLKLLKKKKIEIIIAGREINNTQCDLVTFPIFLKKDYNEINLNLNIEFKRLITINNISINFNKYNHRGYPFNLVLEITQKIFK